MGLVLRRKNDTEKKTLLLLFYHYYYYHFIIIIIIFIIIVVVVISGVFGTLGRIKRTDNSYDITLFYDFPFGHTASLPNFSHYCLFLHLSLSPLHPPCAAKHTSCRILGQSASHIFFHVPYIDAPALP